MVDISESGFIFQRHVLGACS